MIETTRPVTPEQLASWRRLCLRLLRRVSPPPTPVTDAHLVAVLGERPVSLPTDGVPGRVWRVLERVVAEGGADQW